ncbi:MAG TPA: glycosyltransferase [Ignavibacteriaceae bacterium]|nr:glycosyltransferase [Ignavibacteriaceae bacterium]
MAKFLFYDDMLINILLEEEKPSGGAAVQTYAWMIGLIETGHDVSALTNMTGKEKIKQECENLRLIPLYDPDKGIKYIRWIYYRIPYLYKKLRSSKPDYLVQGIPDWSTLFLGIMCKFLRIKLILRVSSDHLIDKRFYQFSTKTKKLMMTLGFSLSSIIICQNSYQYKIIRNKYKSKIIAEFGNPFYYKPVIKISQYGERKYIAWVGLFQFQKNLKLLYEIAYKLKNEEFRIAGDILPAGIDEETREYLDKLKTLKNVQFVGYINKSEVMGFLTYAKYLLCTSRYEGFSNTFLESMACGTPILTTEKANPNNIISNFNLGYVYKDTQELYENYSHFSSGLYSVMSENSLDYVKSKHNYRTLSHELLKLLEIT